jgi:LemA protein
MNQPLRVLAAVLVAAFALGGCQKYDQLIDLDSLCDQRWADLGANLQRRSDLIPNIVATVKGSAKHEEDTLKEVTEARAAATSIRLSSEDLQDPAKVAAFQKAQDGLHSALSRLLVSNEAYPDLKANAAYHDLMVELEGTENRILRAREQYNDAARQYNAELNKIHGSLVKRATGSTFLPRVYFTVSEQATVAPKVTF